MTTVLEDITDDLIEIVGGSSCPEVNPSVYPTFHACVGMRDNPRDHFQPFVGSASSEATAGFQLSSLVQFFDLDDCKGLGLRLNSCVDLIWDSTGHLDMVQLSNYEGDIVPVILWHKNGDYPQAPQEDCIPFPPICEQLSESSSSSAQETRGVIVRLMAMRGSYGTTPQCSISDESAGSESASSESGGSPPEYLLINYDFMILNCQGNPTLDNPRPCFCDPGVLFRKGGASIPGTNSQTMTLCNAATEIDLEFDSTGHLKRVYWSGYKKCAGGSALEIMKNYLVWDRDNPPLDIDGNETAGVIVPVLQFINDDPLGMDFDYLYRVWQIHFDSTGRYIMACEYALMCGCELSVSSESESQMMCPCISQACVWLPDCIETIHYKPPMFVYFLCQDALAAGADCPSSIFGPSSDSSGNTVNHWFCIYEHTEIACPPDPSLSTQASGSAIDSSAPTQQHVMGCLYLNTTGQCDYIG